MTFCSHSICKEQFLEDINKMNLHIQFTTEDAKADGSFPFLKTIVMSQFDNSLLTSVYREPMYTDLYLQWDSHHHLSAKFSVIKPSNTEQRESVLIINYSRRKKATSDKHLKDASIQYGLCTGQASNRRKPTEPTKIPVTAGTVQASIIVSPTWWCPVLRE